MNVLRTNRVPTSNSFIFLSSLLGIVVCLYLLTPGSQIEGSVNLRVANSLAAIIVLLQGVFVLKIVWKLEMRAGGGSLPFAWTYLAIQHLMFGFGGLLVSIFSRNYIYNNDQGDFSWDRAVLPFLIAHAVSMNIGLLGVFAATRVRGRRRSSAQEYERRISRWNVWSWDDTRVICFISLALHSIVWLFIIPIHTRLPESVNYVAYGLAETLNASYVLWGMSWAGCKSKPLFLVYNGLLVMISMLMGQRGEALVPSVLFGIGYLTSPSARRWNWREAVKWAPWAVPLLIFGFWISLAAEDMRHHFTRGSLDGVEDAAARLESMISGNNDDIYYAVGSGDDLNGPFRIGSRLFELSGADVVSRTPSDVPFWGWSATDTSVLLTGLLPLKLNSDAAYNSDPNAGVLFLQTYGWSNVDPSKGNAMPATLIGDSWRRFGWTGVILVSFCVLWIMAKVTILFRSSPWRPGMVLFSAAMLSYNFAAYDSDIIYLVISTPRRVVITAVYVGMVLALSTVSGFSARARRKSRQRRSVMAPQEVASPAAY
jgi:hypothetical protein